MDEHFRKMNSTVPVLAQWDDHETVNNWYPGKVLNDDRYRVKNVDLLSARANRAFLEYMPIANKYEEPSRIYREVPYGPHLDVFMLDMRSYRGKNSTNDQTERSADTDFLGRIQLDWFKKALKTSTATWKVIAADMPIGLVVGDGVHFENSSNGDGPVLGREHDIAEILKFIKDENIQNVVWFTADVHYTAAHYYDPNQAQFQDFTPFWEFVSGPMNAGTFGPNKLDNTFGPQVKYVKAPSEGQGMNLPPSAGLQFFGLVDIAGDSGDMTVRLMDRDNNELYRQTLTPAV